MTGKNRKIRICLPFDRVCLQSGCGHCQDSDHRVTVAQVEKMADEKGWSEDFAYGLRYNWAVR